MNSNGSRPRILVIGAGAVGGYFGGALLRSGNAEIVFAARGATLDALRDRGLTIKSVTGDFTIPTVEAAPLRELDQDFEYIIVCVKNYHLDELLPALQGVVGSRTAVIPLLNGLDAGEAIATTVGRSHAFGGMTYLGVHVEEPGVIIHSAAGRIVVGTLPGPPEPPGAGSAAEVDNRLDDFAILCTDAGIDCKITAAIVLEQWRKLVWNAAINSVTALGRCSIAEALSHSDTEMLIRAAMIEGIMVGQSHGIPLDMSDIEKVVTRARSADVRTSMEVDVARGHRIEFEAINGAIVARGRYVGIPTPVNQTLCSLLKIYDARATAPSK